LFFLDDTVNFDTQVALAESQRVIAGLSAVCGDAYVATSVVIEDGGEIFHAAVVVSRDGLIATQKQLHATTRLAWSSLGDEFVTVDLPFGRLGLVTGADTIYPEVFRMLALQGAEVVAVPFAVKEAWELTTGLVERAAENRLNLVAVTQPSELGCSFANKLHKDFTVLTPWEERPFDGNLTYPLMTRAGVGAGVTMAELTPYNSRDKVVSRGTDLLRGRPWHVAQAITRPL
jgi:predicted amidohydrolase